MQEATNNELSGKLNKIEAEIRVLLATSKVRNEKLLKESDLQYKRLCKFCKLIWAFNIINLILITISIYILTNG